MKINELLAKRVKDIRIAKGLSQRDLGRRMNTSNTTICNIENGTRNITIDTIDKVADALEITATELLNYSEGQDELPDVIQRLHSKYPQIPEAFLHSFSYSYRQGIKLKEIDDYYYLWLFMDGLIKKSD